MTDMVHLLVDLSTVHWAENEKACLQNYQETYPFLQYNSAIQYKNTIPFY